MRVKSPTTPLQVQRAFGRTPNLRRSTVAMSSQQNVRAHSRRITIAAASLLLVLAAVGIGPAQVDLPATICAGLRAVAHVHACKLTLHTAHSA